MPLAYAARHIFRSWKLFLVLLISITLASAFFSGTEIKAHVTAEQALNQQLDKIPVDMAINVNMAQNWTQILKIEEKVSAVEAVSSVEVVSIVEGHTMLVNENGLAKEYDVKTIGITNDSRIYDGWSNKPSALGENETYVLEGLQLESQINHTIQINFTAFYSWEAHKLKGRIPINLTLKGFAQLDDNAYSLAHAITYDDYLGQSTRRNTRLLILMVDWKKTMLKLMEVLFKMSPSDRLREGRTRVLVHSDRDTLIAPWDIDTSINNIMTLEYTIKNKIAELGLYADVQNNLEWSLNDFRSTSMNIKFMITLISLPIFFVAWYTGTTVSDVSFNLRRREIGLLSTKGFSRGQLLTIFLTETLLIGTIGSALGLSFGFLLNLLFTKLSVEAFFNPRVISPYTVIFTMLFGLLIAFLSTFRSARKASRLTTVDALREYLPMEMKKPYKKRWPWVAFVLGTYKIAVFILGLNISFELARLGFGAGNFVVDLLISFWLVVDGILNYIGPLLFFWGFMKLFIQGSLKFKGLTVKAARFLGDLSVLATKSVRRNPARSAAIAFLIALIVGYSVQITGLLASEQDYTVRLVYRQIGSDAAIYVPLANDAPCILDVVMENVSGETQNATIEYSFSAYSSNLMGYLKLKAVEPGLWLKAAYYENEWFSGSDVTTAFKILAANKGAIILEHTIANRLKLKVGDTIALKFETNPKTFKIVGFFGPSQSQSPVGTSQDFLQYWSFVSERFYKDIETQVSASAKILLKLKSGADSKSVTENIRDLSLNIDSVESFVEEWEETQSDVITMGVLDVQRLGIVFAVLAASVGTALVSVVSMKERNREATIMSVKGLSYKHLTVIFLTENLALVAFSAILGITVGLIVVYGNISATNAAISSLIQHRLVFPPDATLTVSLCIALIFVSTISPILIILRRYVTGLERVVGLR
jgi:ABC-type antimicrobial peptide transport system permease subunit